MSGRISMTTREIVTAFYAGIERMDLGVLRGLLHEHLDFRGPMGRTGDAEAFIVRLAKLSCLTHSLRVTHLFVDGDRACCVYDRVTATPLGDNPVAEYLELRDGRIAAIRAHHDARPWRALFSRGTS